MNYIQEVHAWNFNHAAKLAADAGANLAAEVCAELARLDNARKNQAFEMGVMRALENNDWAMLIWSLAWINAQ